MSTEDLQTTDSPNRFLPEGNVKLCADSFNDKSILVTGGTGSFGKAFIEKVLNNFSPKKIVVFSRDELKQSILKSRFPTSKFPCMRYFLGDVRDASRLVRAFRGIDIVIHAAALKQVPALEYNPTEAIKTNVMGAMNITAAAIECGVSRVVALSTDKAAMPINLYGATKLCSDKLFVAANTAVGEAPTRLAVVRYGNVFGSRGSIVPVFHKKKMDGETCLSLTDVRMTRFNITLNQAVNFVISGVYLMRGGEIFVPKLPSYKLPDIAAAIAPECETKVIGRRPGEKIHELMIPSDEAYRTKEIEDRFIIEPEWGEQSAFQYDSIEGAQPVPEGMSYSSGSNDDWCTIETLRNQYEDWCLNAEHIKK